MIISCAIYISLICNKKKKFKNKVSVDRNPFEMTGIVELNNESVKGQVKTRYVKSPKSSTASNVVTVECQSNDKDKHSENLVILIEKFEHSAENIDNECLQQENCRSQKCPCGNVNSCWSSLVEDSYFKNTEEKQVTKTADNYNTDTNNVVKCIDIEIGLAGCLENNRKKLESSETLGNIENKMNPKCFILYKSFGNEEVENVKSCALSLKGESETYYEEKLLHQNDLSPNLKIIQIEDMYLGGPSPNFFDCSTQMDAKETQKDLKEKGNNENPIENACTISEINSIFECPKNSEVSMVQL